MSMYFDLDMSRCSACGACAIACMDQNDIEISENERPFRSAFCLEDGLQKMNFYSVACMHCDDAPCVFACPAGCISKDPDTNLTVYDNKGCIGCHSCAMACPFGAPGFDAEGKMQKCDGCIERIRHGLIPACVKVCHAGALQLVHDGEEADIVLSLKNISDKIVN